MEASRFCTLRPWDQVELPSLEELPASPRPNHYSGNWEYRRELVRVNGHVRTDTFDVVEGIVTPQDCTVTLLSAGSEIATADCKAGVTKMFHSPLLLAAMRMESFNIKTEPALAQYDLVVGVLPAGLRELWMHHSEEFTTKAGCRKHALVYGGAIRPKYYGPAFCSCPSTLNASLPAGSPPVLKVGKPAFFDTIPCWEVLTGGPLSRPMLYMMNKDGSGVLTDKRLTALDGTDCTPLLLHWSSHEKAQACQRI